MNSSNTENTLFTTLIVGFFLLMIISFFYKPANASNVENTPKAVVNVAEQPKANETTMPRVVIVGKRLHKHA